MSRVTIGKLAADFVNATPEERHKTINIEVVPRKVVEDIIETCDEYQESLTKKINSLQHSEHEVTQYHAKVEALMFVMHVAEELLRDFEEGEEA